MTKRVDVFIPAEYLCAVSKLKPPALWNLMYALIKNARGEDPKSGDADTDMLVSLICGADKDGK